MKHPDFKLLDLPESALYAYEIMKYASPYVAAAGFIYTLYNTWWKERQEAKFQHKLFAKLNEIQAEVEKSRKMILDELRSQKFKDMAGVIFGAADRLYENPNQNTVDWALNELVAVKNTIALYLEDENTEVDYYYLYSINYVIAISMRVAYFGLDHSNTHEENEENVKGESRDLLRFEASSLKAAHQIGELRVTKGAETFHEDTIPPTTFYTTWIQVDGKNVWAETYPRPDHHTIGEEQRQYEYFQKRCREEAAKPLQDLYRKAKKDIED